MCIIPKEICPLFLVDVITPFHLYLVIHSPPLVGIVFFLGLLTYLMRDAARAGEMGVMMATVAPNIEPNPMPPMTGIEIIHFGYSK